MALAALWDFIKKIPGWVWLVVAGLVVGFAYVEAEKARARKETNEKRDKDALREQAKVSETRREIAKENQDAIERADEAVSDLPVYRHTDELRQNDPNAASIVLGSGARDGV